MRGRYRSAGASP